MATLRRRSLTFRRAPFISARTPFISASRALPRIGRSPGSFWPGLGLALLGAFVLAAAVPRAIAMARHGRRVADVMVGDVVTIDPSATLLAAAQLMRDTNVGVLPIVENGRLRGLVTDRDLVVRAMARAVDPEVTPVRYFESDDVVAIEPDWDVEEALALMRRNKVGRLPVVDATNRLVGIVTLSSLALRSRDDDAALDTAKDVARRSARAVA